MLFTTMSAAVGVGNLIENIVYFSCIWVDLYMKQPIRTPQY